MSRKSFPMACVARLRAMSWVCVAAALCSSAAAAQNLIVNGDFDDNVASWVLFPEPGASLSWSPEDAAGDAASGSAVALYESPGQGASFVEQCVPVVAGTRYRLSAKLRVPPGQNRTGRAIAGTTWWSIPGCLGVAIEADQHFFQLATPGQWTSFSSVVRAPAGAVGAQVRMVAAKDQDGGSFRSQFDQFVLEATESACAGGDTALCLGDQRFKVEATWRTPAGQTGAGHAVSLTEDSGYFWFFEAANSEVFVKVKNACVAPFDRFWFFAAGLTNVRVELKVTDTETDTVKTYVNPQNTAFKAIQDTDAFATCP